MRITVIIILINLILISCGNDTKNAIVIISEINKKYFEHKKQIKNRFYNKYNFILTSDDKMYYFINTHVIDCAPDCLGFDFSKPEFLGIWPGDVKEIQPDSLKSTLEKIALTIFNAGRSEIITISSDADTIKNKALTIFIDFAKIQIKDSLRIGYNYRLMTEEEQVVLEAKRKNAKYNPDSVTWKSDFSKLKFSVPMDNN